MGSQRGRASRVVDLGNAETPVEASADVTCESLETEMGSFKERFGVRTIPRKGLALIFDVATGKGAESVILEIQEIHNRRPDAFGYLVLVNDREVYFRTYQELGAGPNHFFVEVPRDLVKPGLPLRVTLSHEGGGPFSIGQVWVYENFFDQVAGPESVFRPLGLLLPPGAIKLEGDQGNQRAKDDASTLARYELQKARFDGLKDFAPIGTLAYGGAYGGQEPRQQREAGILKGFQLSAQSGMPGQMMLNGLGWFSGPTGPDGLGGFFSDIRYNKSFFSAAKGVYQASWPNIWGNTPAFTLRDPNLNAYLETRFQQMMAGSQEELALLKLNGTPAQPILIREFAPASGEITDAIIGAAAQEGVILDPSDGMSLEERMWMHHDAVRTWQEYADSTRKAVGRDVVIVNEGKVLLPEEQLFDNLYAHPNFMTDDPAGDPRWGGGQHGMVDGLWSSGEIGATSGHRDIGGATKFRDVVMYDYLPARGKFAVINLERTMLKEDFSVLRLHYERGAQFVTLYNADDGDEVFVRKVDGMANQPASPPPHCQPVVSMTREPDPAPAGKQETAFHREALYRLANAGDPFTSGLALHLDGRISPGAANRIEIWAGLSPDQMASVVTLTEKDLPDPNHWTPQMTSQTTVNLGDFMIGSTQAYVRFVFHAEGAEDAAFLIGQEAQTRWSRQSGYVAPSSLTKAQARTLQLWLQERSVGARLLKYYSAAGGEDEVYRQALDLFDRGWYRSARRLLGSEISQVLPARYLVRGKGPLGRYPVQVMLEAPADHAFVTLESIGPPEGCVFSLATGREAQPVSLAFSGLDAARSWALTSPQPGRYRLSQPDAGVPDERVTVRDGYLQVSLVHTNPAPAARALPARLVARCRGGGKGRITVEVQDLALMEYASSLTLPVIKDVALHRAAARLEHPDLAKSEWPQPLDEVSLTLNEKGEVTAIDSRYGYDRGRIKAFHPPVIVGGADNGSIELENGNRYQLVFEKGSGRFNTVALQGTLVGYEIQTLGEAIKPGHEVEIRYSPYAEKGGLPRIIEVTQPREVLLDVDYTKDQGGAWTSAAHEVKGVAVRMHKPEPNYLYKVELPLLRPVEGFTPGHVIYHIRREAPLKTTAVEFAARAFEKSSRVTFYTSPDGATWTRAGQFDNTWQCSISQSLGSLPYQFMDLTPFVEGLTSFYLKVELAVNAADHRYCLAKLRIATEKSP